MRSLRVRLLVALLVMLAIAAAIMGALTYRSVRAETEGIFDYQLKQMALSLLDQGEIAPDQAPAFVDEQLDFVVQIWTVDGRAIYQSRPHSDLPARALLGFADISAGGQTWRTYSVATTLRVIQVAQPLQIREQLAANAALHSVAPLLLIAPVLALVVWWVAALTLRPLREVAADVQRRDEQSLTPLPTKNLPEEVSPLVSALNALLQRLSQSLDTQRAFVSDAAHELRSPLTALKLQLEMLRRAPDDASRETAVDALSAGIDRATRLVEQLLVLARVEPGAPPAALEPLDLSEVVRQAMADTVPLALARGVHARCRARTLRRCAGTSRRRPRGAERVGAQPHRQRDPLLAQWRARRCPRVDRRRRACLAGGRRRPRHSVGRARAGFRSLLSAHERRVGQRIGPGHCEKRGFKTPREREARRFAARRFASHRSFRAARVLNRACLEPGA